MTMREAWSQQAQHWLDLVGRGLDAGWPFSSPRFLELVPSPGLLTVDVGCGEGRLGRVLSARGHRVVGLDATWEFTRAAAENEAPIRVVVADAARLPLRDSSADLVVAFMSLLDIDDYVEAIGEVRRILMPGGRFCFAIVHPMAESGRFDDSGAFTVTRPYGAIWRYPDHLARDGVEMTFHSEHRPIEAYSRALEAAGLAIEAIREPVPNGREIDSARDEDRWRRVPNFLMMRTRVLA
jgi:SAM-dependent methyltransferase